MKNDKLLPCPFCDCKLHKHHRYYHHEINGCLFDDYMFFKEDFKKWNTRKPVERILDRLKEMFKHHSSTKTVQKLVLETVEVCISFT